MLPSVLDWIFPSRCVLCGRTGSGLCAGCALNLEPSSAPPPPGLDCFVAVFDYSGTGREVVLALKRGNRRDVVPLLGEALAEALAECLGRVACEALRSDIPAADPPAVVTWAPTTARRRRARGFDQAELLARSVARSSGWPAEGLLCRVGGAQHGSTRSQRWSNLDFLAIATVTGTVVVVDDVVASGATMAAAGAALRRAGAGRVIGAAVATSPPRR